MKSMNRYVVTLLIQADDDEDAEHTAEELASRLDNAHVISVSKPSKEYGGTAQ